MPLGRALRRGWPLVALIAAVALAAGLFAASRQDVSYANTARLLVNPLSQSAGQLLGIDFIRSAGDADRTAQTAAVLIESNEIAQEAARRLGGEWTRASVLEAVTVAPEQESKVLAVKATTDDPTNATRVANGFATSAVSLRERRINEQVGARLRTLKQDLRSIRSEDYAGRDNALEEIQELQAVQKRGDLSLSLVQTAVTPGETIKTPTALIAAMALLGGLLLGTLAALLLDQLRIRARERVGAPGPRDAGEAMVPPEVLRPAHEPVR